MKKVAIIGSGISGLYAGLLLEGKGYEYMMYERSNYFGGRIKMVKFCGRDVIAGAGIGRYMTDHLLYDLCTKVGVVPFRYISQVSYAGIELDFSVQSCVDYLKEKMKKESTKKAKRRMTFREFGMKHLGEENYGKFVLYVGETDFENADYVDVLTDYKFEFSTSGWEGFSIDWKAFLKAFRKKVGNRIKFGVNVSGRLKKKGEKFVVDGILYDKVIIATGIKSVAEILDDDDNDENIACQSFVRLYVKLDGPLNISTRLVITDKPFQKIIEIDRKECIYMISYCDNEIAEMWARIKDEEKIRGVVERGIKKLFGQKLKVLNKKLIYWECGTHYFLPLDVTRYKTRDEYLSKIQNPMKNVFVVGEAFSREQGWCEGALQSVEKIIGLI
jgi:hypothetical protein